MQTLSFEEINLVSGARAIETVNVTAKRMTPEEKYAYDIGNSISFGQAGFYTMNWFVDQIFGWEYR